jgi:carbon-monoxide dehydrogenase small subunit
MDKQYVTLTVNGRRYQFSIGNGFGEVPASETLSQTLRKRLQLTGSKESCSEGACGCCTVLMDNTAVTSCMLLTIECDGREIITIEGLESPEFGLDPLQQAFIDEYSFQCGYCTPGIIMAAKGLLISNPHPTNEEIEEAMSGNYCRCISQYTVLRAINRVAGNEDDHHAIMVRANDEEENPIPVRQQLFLSPYANGSSDAHTLD